MAIISISILIITELEVLASELTPGPMLCLSLAVCRGLCTHTHTLAQPALTLAPSTKLSCLAGWVENINETDGSEGTNGPHSRPSLWDKLSPLAGPLIFHRHPQAPYPPRGNFTGMLGDTGWQSWNEVGIHEASLCAFECIQLAYCPSVSCQVLLMFHLTLNQPSEWAF